MHASRRRELKNRVVEMPKNSDHLTGRVQEILNILKTKTRSELLETVDFINEHCKSETPRAMPQVLRNYLLFSDDKEKRRDYRNSIGLSELRIFIADLWVYCQQDFSFDPKRWFNSFYKGRQKGRAYGPSHRTH